MRCIFLGPPGAGKGTLAFEVSKRYKIPHISTGELFRTAIKNRTELGKKVKSVIDSGALVSDDLTVALVKERLEKNDTENGFILDGFPRTIAQADALEKIAAVDSVINFTIPDEDVVTRLSGRRVCSSCGKGYHIEFVKPAREGICDSCGSALIIREDDAVDAIKKRLEVYRKETAPLIDYYTKKNLTVDIDARPAAEEVVKTFEKKIPARVKAKKNF